MNLWQITIGLCVFSGLLISCAAGASRSNTPTAAAAAQPAAKPAAPAPMPVAQAPQPATKPAVRPGSKNTDRAEVLMLGPNRFEGHVYDLIYSYLLESGIYLELDDHDRLPEELPWDLSQYKVIIVDKSLPVVEYAGFKEHLDRYAAQGGTVIYHTPPAETNWKANDPEMYEVYNKVVAAGVKLQNPAFLKRNAARPDRDVILSSTARQTTVPGLVGWYRIGNDVAFMHFEGILKTAELYNRPDLRDFVLWMLDDIVRTHGDKPLPVFGGHLVDQFQKLGRQDYYERCMKSLRPASMLVDRVEFTRRTNPAVACETVSGLGDFMALAKHAPDPNEYYQPLVDMMKLCHDALFEPTTQLWAHGGTRGGEPTPAWSRGYGWMLIGLVGIIENLPKDHPDYPLMVQYLEETTNGLSRYQDATGLWHCIVDDPNTRLEASGTAMILRSYCHAWRAGVCRTPQVKAMLTKAWYGLKTHTVGGRTFSFLWGQGATHDKSAYAVNPSSGTPYLAPLAGPEYVITFGPLVP